MLKFFKGVLVMNTEFHQEQKRVDRVKETISDEMKKVKVEMEKRKKIVDLIRKGFWDEVKINIDTFDDYFETVIGLRQEAQTLAINENAYSHAKKRFHTLQRMQEIPYFGRIDFHEEGESSYESVYIGISSLRDESGENFLVYDWRAPISSVYYDYSPGPAKYETPGGTVSGELLKKWQYLIRRGVLQSMFDTSITIGDEILQKVLGKGTDKQMHNIVATIQKEQNRIIRHDGGRLLIVHGPAGSGKTSAALQRIAYLLYKYRDVLQSEQIILFSPNALFSHYVSNVLPELGEENMQQMTFQRYLHRRLGSEFDVESPYEQLEFVLTKNGSRDYDTRLASIRFKASARFFGLIESYCKSLEQKGMLFHDLLFRGKPIVTAEQMVEQFYRYPANYRLHHRLEHLQKWLLKEIKKFQRNERKEEWVEEEMQYLSKEQLRKAHALLAKKRGYSKENQVNYEMQPAHLADLIVSLRLRSVRKQVRTLQFIDIKGLYRQLFADPTLVKDLLKGDVPDEWPAICQWTLEMLEGDQLFYEDATPFLLLRELILGFQTNREIKHIVVDEAQDYSPFQFEYLKRIYPQARMTILGDFHQAIFAHASDSVDFTMLTNLYGPEQTESIHLTKSYRSTKPIIEFTRKLVPNGEQIIPFDRDGEKPKLQQVDSYEQLHRCIAEKVAEWRKLGLNSIAIICKSAEECKEAFEGLGMIEGLKQMKSTSSEYEQGVVVIPMYLAKGIEFDGVIIYNASNQVYGEESLRRAFYTACTRAMHHLQLYSVGEPSRFLQNALQEGVLEI